MGDFIDFIKMVGLLIQGIFHAIIFIIGLFFLPYHVLKHYDEQKKRSREMAFTARSMGMRLDQALDRSLDKTYRFLRKVGGDIDFESHEFSERYDVRRVRTRDLLSRGLLSR